jgi:hypothetical protein
MDIGTGTKNVPISCSSNLLESSTKETYHEELSSRKISSKAEIERSFKSSLPAAAKDPRNKINIPNANASKKNPKIYTLKYHQNPQPNVLRLLDRQPFAPLIQILLINADY